MTDNEIGFILECYKADALRYKDGRILMDSNAMIAIAEFIEQQKTEIDELQLKNAELQLKIDELRANNKAIMQTIAGVREEAVKEFAKKIEDTPWYHINSEGKLMVGANGESDVPLYKAEDILKITKEMVGDNE